MIAYTYYLSDPRVRREAEALIERGDEVTFICLRKDREKRFETINGVNVFRLPQKRYRGGGVLSYIRGYISFFISSFLKLNSLYLYKKYDVVHINNMPDFLVFITFIPKIFGAKVILDIHDLMPELYAAKFRVNISHPFIRLLFIMEKVSCRFSDYVITVNKLCWKRLILRSVKQEKCGILMNLPDEKIFKPIQPRADEPLAQTATQQHSSTSFNLIYHGTLVKRYGLDIAIKAVSLVKDKIPNIKFNIYGEGEILTELLNLVKKYGLEKQIYFSKEFFPLEQMPNFIAKADIGISPRRKDKITDVALSSKLLEYIAMGIPVVVSRTGLTNRYFNDSMAAFFEPGNEKDLADKVLYLYNNPKKRKELAESALKFFRKYNWQTEKQKYYRIIDKLLG